jgi:hypothetical protein
MSSAADFDFTRTTQPRTGVKEGKRTSLPPSMSGGLESELDSLIGPPAPYTSGAPPMAMAAVSKRHPLKGACMFRIRFARCLLILLLVAAVSAPSAWGAPLRLSNGVSSVNIVAWAWESVVALWEKAGAHLDPHGLSVILPSPPADAGCGIDPHGVRAAQPETSVQSPTTEAGCTIDPHGVCTPGS